ncbi:EAL domain-containing protein [Treponema sp.]|uniref:EAL domain-containing protein n=1 Tax=Treponema sp. TaxID=166 RepID=UPI0025CD0254|nr:EAL domain-containing protein [Treponema sp.]MCR5218005.1 EAL domain-containing protein [Treponema sp.]
MKLLRFFAALVIILLLAPTASFSLSYNENNHERPEILLGQKEKEAVLKHKRLNVVIDPNWKPLEYNKTPGENNFNPAGLNVEYLKEIAAILNVELNFIATENYTQSIDLIRNNKADIISGYTRLLDIFKEIRQSTFSYSSQLLLASTTGSLPEPGDVVGITEFPPELIEELKKEIGVQNLIIQTTPKPEITLDKFKSGEFKYIIIGQPELSYTDKLPEHKAFNLSLTYYQQFGFSSKIEPEFITAFNKAIKTIPTSELNLIFYQLQREKELEKEKNLQKMEVFHTRSIFFLSHTVILAALIISIMLAFLRYKIHEITYDDITGLHTYSRFRRDVIRILKKHREEKYIFLCINIDNFGFINDSYGFNYGNKILSRIARHFIEECKKGEKYCRYYADTFIFFIKAPESLPLIEDKVYKLTDVSSHIADMLPNKYIMTFSSGVYYINRDEDINDITGMVTKANIARKLNKKNFVTHRTAEYTQEMKKENDWNREITLSMNKALENREFIVYYQPKFSLKTGRIIGAEALIRWNKPETGLLGPDKFVPLFEHNGFIEKIDIYVFNDVCRFINEWNHIDNGNCPYPITISFNLSRYHLYDTDLIEKLTGISRNFQIEPNCIEVELTESIMFDNMKRLVRVMNDIKKAGFKISVDDFGSGYSSLNILKNMPADVIKLDKEFLHKTEDTSKDSIIMESVINMAKKLNMQTVIEGIETKEQSELLTGIGCDIAQGFYFARPMPGEDFLDLLKKYI